MFDRKKQKVTVPTIETKQVTVPTVAGLKSAVIPAAAGAAAAAKHLISEQADKGSAAAGPKLAEARAVVAPHLDQARGRVEEDVLPRVAEAKDQLADAKDQFVEETLPKLITAVSGAIAASSVAKSDAVGKLRDSDAAHRATDAALVLKGDAVAKRKKEGGFLRGLFATLGLLAVAGGVAWFFNKKAAEQDDPWARPLADPYVPPTTGRDSSVAATPVTTPGGVTQEAPATFAPTVGQVSEVPAADHDLVPPSDTAVADNEIKVVDVDEAVAKAEHGDAPRTEQQEHEQHKIDQDKKDF